MAEKKFDPARAHLLDAPEREQYLPSARIVDALALSGGELVVDYGAGTGRLTREVAARLHGGGRVLAVEENDQMYALLSERLEGVEQARALRIEHDRVPLPDGAVDRILAVNLLHEIRGDAALAEMRRLLADRGLLLVVDWERGRPRTVGPPDELLYSADEAAAELRDAGFRTRALGLALPFHFAILAARDPAAAAQPDAA